MTVPRTGDRLRSVVCSTEVIVIRSPKQELSLKCGGAALVPLGQGEVLTGEPDPEHAAGTLVGKRYTNGDASLEILCTKAGAGSLSCDDGPLVVKSAKPLPSSD